MNTPNTPDPTKTKAFFCPSCGGASVDTTVLTDEATCKICSWKGKVAELAAFSFQHGFASAEEIDRAFFLDIRTVMAKYLAVEIGKFLIKWGFLPELSPKLFARYIGAAASGLVTALVRERAKIEKEKLGDG